MLVAYCALCDVRFVLIVFVFDLRGVLFVCCLSRVVRQSLFDVRCAMLVFRGWLFCV